MYIGIMTLFGLESCTSPAVLVQGLMLGGDYRRTFPLSGVIIFRLGKLKDPLETLRETGD